MRDLVKAGIQVLKADFPHIAFFATAHCNIGCNHCFYRERIRTAGKRDELSLDEIKKISESLGNIYSLTLTGGEPTLRDDLIGIAKVFYGQNRLRLLSLHSNGYAPEKLLMIARGILNGCPGMRLLVSLSLDGLEQKHDALRIAGSFQGVLESVRCLKPLLAHRNFELFINTTLMPENQDDIMAIHDYVVNVLHLPHDVSYLRGRKLKKREHDSMLKAYKSYKDRNDTPAAAGAASLIRDIIIRTGKDFICQAERGDGRLPCQALRKSIVINETGEVFPCEVLASSVGNLREFGYDVKRLLQSKKAECMRSEIEGKCCSCTWECIMPVNILYSVQGRIALLRNLARYSLTNLGLASKRASR